MPDDAPAPPPQAAHPLAAHFYRAVVSHADVWRTRMDATTNWAAATTAGMITFSFSAPTAPHVVLLLSLAFDVVFLLMESRRYQVYDLWRRRFRTLNQHLVVPVLLGAAPRASGPDYEAAQRGLASVAEDLGGTVPHLGLLDAVGYRIRRNYGYIFSLVLLAWTLKLDMHPAAARSAGELMGRAAIGFIAAPYVWAAVMGAVLVCAILAIRAPSEHMIRWAVVPSPLSRLVTRSRGLMPEALRGAFRTEDRP
jgi:uncharacterized membrane protein